MFRYDAADVDKCIILISLIFVPNICFNKTDCFIRF